MQGTVVVSFIVNTDGTTSEAKIVRPKHPDLDREAMRVVRMMPKWKPGEDHGKPCRAMIAIPIVFKI
jgi:protein TonB